MVDGFVRHDLDGYHTFYSGRLPEALAFDAARFEGLWAIHPGDYHVIQMNGRPVKTPRWQQAYGRDCHYTGRGHAALPVPPPLEPLLAWAREAVHGRLNGLLLNWYDGRLGHDIGPHHDSTKGMVADAPIVTVSLGEEWVFRLTQPGTKERRGFPAPDGTDFVMPSDTNLAWKREVPRSARWRGRRISVTLRGFEDCRVSPWLTTKCAAFPLSGTRLELTRSDDGARPPTSAAARADRLGRRAFPAHTSPA
jgi:alkylated DNA repair dioxygenase AlkB